jgi:hypothetical protein
MNDKNQENRASRGPLIFTVAAYGLIVAVNRDSCFTSQKRRASRPRKTYSPPLSSTFLAISREILDR